MFDFSFFRLHCLVFDIGYSRNALCTLNLIFAFFFSISNLMTRRVSGKAAPSQKIANQILFLRTKFLNS